MQRLPAFQKILSEELLVMSVELFCRSLNSPKRRSLADEIDKWQDGPLNITCWAADTFELDRVTIDGAKIWQAVRVRRAFVKEKKGPALLVHVSDSTDIGRRDKPQWLRWKKDGKPMPNTKEFLDDFHVIDFFPRLPHLTFDEERALKQFHVFSKLYLHSPRPA